MHGEVLSRHGHRVLHDVRVVEHVGTNVEMGGRDVFLRVKVDERSAWGKGSVVLGNTDHTVRGVDDIVRGGATDGIVADRTRGWVGAARVARPAVRHGGRDDVGDLASVDGRLEGVRPTLGDVGGGDEFGRVRVDPCYDYPTLAMAQKERVKIKHDQPALTGGSDD